MVNPNQPAWGSFSKPNFQPDIQEKTQEQELEQEVPGMMVDQEKPEAEKPQWGNFQSPMTYQGEPDPTADEGWFDYLLRGSARTASRVAEQAFGAVGNIEKFSKDILSSVPETGGLIGWAISEYLGLENWERMIRGRPDAKDYYNLDKQGPMPTDNSDLKDTPRFGKQTFPTSQEIKGISEKATGGYTSPKTKNEKRLDELTEDVAGTFISRRIPAGRMTQAANHFLIPAAANVTKNIIEDLGFGEDKANMAKMAIWLPMTLANNVNGPQYASSLMNRGRNGFDQNLTVNVPQYGQQLNNVRLNMLHGDPRSALAQQQLAGISHDIANGQTSMRDLMTRYDAINAAKRDRGLFELGARDRAAAIRNINQVRDVVREQIYDLGSANPQALRDWQNGVQAWATIHRSNAITNYVQDLAKGPYAKILSGPAAALFGIGSFGAASSPLIAGPLALIAGGTYKTSQVLYRMWNDPNLRNYYFRAIGGAMAENTPVFINNYQKLNKELEKDSGKKGKK